MSATNLDDSFNAPSPRAVAPPTIEDVLDVLKWSTPREVPTKNGPRMLSSAPANQVVFDLFKAHRNELFNRGISLGEWPRNSGKWQVSKWEKVPEKIVVQRTSAAALSRATDADINVPAPDGLSYLGYQRAGICFALRVFGELCESD